MPAIMPNVLTECKTEVSYLVLTTLGTYNWLRQSYVIILVRFICIMEDNVHFLHIAIPTPKRIELYNGTWCLSWDFQESPRFMKSTGEQQTSVRCRYWLTHCLTDKLPTYQLTAGVIQISALAELQTAACHSPLWPLSHCQSHDC